MFLLKFMRSALLALSPVLISVSACSAKSSTSEYNALSAGIVREGATTDAALDEFLNTEPDAWPWAGGQFQAPTDQAVLSADTPEQFQWQSAPTDSPNPNDPPAAAKQNGQVYLLAFGTSTGTTLLRVFSSLTSFTPNAEDWRKLVSAPQPITLNLTTATFENDRLTEDGGPHTGQSIQFTIQ